MNWFEAFILGIIQGLTEFLPVSSSGHIAIGKVLLGVEVSENLIFSVVVHGATSLSTIIIFRKEILELIKGLFKFRNNLETQYLIAGVDEVGRGTKLSLFLPGICFWWAQC